MSEGIGTTYTHFMALSLLDIVKLLNHHAKAEDHKVFVDGVETGKCVRASFRPVISFAHGFELVLDYTLDNAGAKTTYSSRLHQNQLKSGGGEKILVNGQDVDDDDVIVGADASAGPGTIYVEFKFSQAGTAKRVKFAAPATAFK